MYGHFTSTKQYNLGPPIMCKEFINLRRSWIVLNRVKTVPVIYALHSHTGRFKGANGAMPPKLGPQQVPGEAIWRLAGGAYSDRPRLLAGGRRIASQEPHTRCRPYGPRALAPRPSPLTRNRELSLSQHDRLDPPMHSRIRNYAYPRNR